MPAHRLLRCPALTLMLLFGAWCLAAGCGRPITVHALMEGSQTPVADVRIYRYRFSLFSPLPTGRSVHTNDQGTARVSVGPNATNLTMLRQGFEPVLLGVFEKAFTGLQPDPGGYDYVIFFEALQDWQVVPVEFRPVRHVPMQVTVTDGADGTPMPDAEVLATTFLYLPQPGAEERWGYPPTQRQLTDVEGQATVDQVSGFRNRFTVRKPGYQDATLDVDGRQELHAHHAQVVLHPRRVKQVEFLVLDADTRKPVPGAEVRLGAPRNGLAPAADAWHVRADAQGRTGKVPVPEALPCVIVASADRYRERYVTPLWRALEEDQTVRVYMKRK